MKHCSLGFWDQAMNLEVIFRHPSQSPHLTPLLFVHGAWHGAWCWTEHFLDYFASSGYSTYALSLRGHGASSGRDRLRWTSLSDYVHTAPAAVLLASVPPSGIIASTLRIARRHPRPVANGIFRLTLYPLVSTPELTREAFFSSSLSQDKLLGYFAQLQDESYRAFLDMMLFNLPKPSRVNTPTQVIGAENDTIFNQDEIEATARAYSTQAVIFPGMAHDLMLEEGWQSVADRIIGWLSEKGF